MKARIISYDVDGEVKFQTVTNCLDCTYFGDIQCTKTKETLRDTPKGCPFPKVLDVLVRKEM